jgi:hypothetical protein
MEIAAGFWCALAQPGAHTYVLSSAPINFLGCSSSRLTTTHNTRIALVLHMQTQALVVHPQILLHHPPSSPIPSSISIVRNGIHHGHPYSLPRLHNKQKGKFIIVSLSASINQTHRLSPLSKLSHSLHLRRARKSCRPAHR